jgi:hypothetical protein
LVTGVKRILVPPTMAAVPLVGLTAMMVNVPPGVSTMSFVNGFDVLLVFSVVE